MLLEFKRISPDMGLMIVAIMISIPCACSEMLSAETTPSTGSPLQPSIMSRRLFDLPHPFNFYSSSCAQNCHGISGNLDPFLNACPQCPDKYESAHCNHCCHGGASSLKLRWHGCHGTVTFSTCEQARQNCEVDSCSDGVAFVSCECYELLKAGANFESAPECDVMSSIELDPTNETRTFDICLASVNDADGPVTVDMSVPLPDVIGLVHQPSVTTEGSRGSSRPFQTYFNTSCGILDASSAPYVLPLFPGYGKFPNSCPNTSFIDLELSGEVVLSEAIDHFNGRPPIESFWYEFIDGTSASFWPQNGEGFDFFDPTFAACECNECPSSAPSLVPSVLASFHPSLTTPSPTYEDSEIPSFSPTTDLPSSLPTPAPTTSMPSPAPQVATSSPITDQPTLTTNVPSAARTASNESRIPSSLPPAPKPSATPGIDTVQPTEHSNMPSAPTFGVETNPPTTTARPSSPPTATIAPASDSAPTTISVTEQPTTAPAPTAGNTDSPPSTDSLPTAPDSPNAGPTTAQPSSPRFPGLIFETVQPTFSRQQGLPGGEECTQVDFAVCNGLALTSCRSIGNNGEGPGDVCFFQENRRMLLDLHKSIRNGTHPLKPFPWMTRKFVEDQLNFHSDESARLRRMKAGG